LLASLRSAAPPPLAAWAALTFLTVGQAIQQVVYGMIVLGLAWGYAGLTRRG